MCVSLGVCAFYWIKFNRKISSTKTKMLLRLAQTNSNWLNYNEYFLVGHIRSYCRCRCCYCFCVRWCLLLWIDISASKRASAHNDHNTLTNSQYLLHFMRRNRRTIGLTWIAQFNLFCYFVLFSVFLLSLSLFRSFVRSLTHSLSISLWVFAFFGIAAEWSIFLLLRIYALRCVF